MEKFYPSGEAPSKMGVNFIFRNIYLPLKMFSFSLIQFQSFCCFRPLTSGEGGKTRLLGKHKRPAQTSRSVASEAKEVATSVRSMIDTQRE